MNWDAVGAIGETIGALAVVMSLVYLAIQIRIQNKEARLASVHEILVGFRETLHVFATGDVAEVMAKANEDYESLSNSEFLRFLAGILPVLRLWEEAFVQNEQGRLENRFWIGINGQCSDFLSYPSISGIWELRSKHFDSNFQSHVSKLKKAEVDVEVR
jgi:hypothetical protein